jgi:hypothetical protein
VVVADAHVFVADGDAGLLVVDIADPDAPFGTGTVSTSDAARDVAWQDGIVYVAAGVAGLRIIDASDPANPFEIAHLPSSGEAQGVTVQGDRLYLADDGGGLRIADVSNPSAPQYLGVLYSAAFAQDVVVQGSYAFVADYYTGLRIVDVSDPTTPVAAGFYETGGYATGVALSDGLAFIADGDDGLWIFAADLLTAVAPPVPSVAARLLGAYPNPFNPRTTIRFEVPTAGQVRLAIHDAGGRLVTVLRQETLAAGRHEVLWRGNDRHGRSVASGVYIVSLESANWRDTQAVVLVR